MSTAGLLVAFILVLIVLAAIVLPLILRADGTENALVEKQRERLQVYYDRVVRNMRDLDEDFALGKMHEAAYQVERELWASRGVQVLRALDGLNADAADAVKPLRLSTTSASDAAVDAAIDALIEQEVRRAREDVLA